MDKTAQKEFLLIGLTLLIFIILLIPALKFARADWRDSIRRAELINLKIKLEQYNNKKGFYPIVYDASPHQYLVINKNGDGASKWFLRAEMENKSKEQQGFDLENNVYFRYLSQNKKNYYDICGGDYKCE